jgi:hypothetical protein
MDDIRQTAIDRFQAYLEPQQFSVHTSVGPNSTYLHCLLEFL